VFPKTLKRYTFLELLYYIILFLGVQQIVFDLYSLGPIVLFTAKINHHRVKFIICTCFVLPI